MAGEKSVSIHAHVSERYGQILTGAALEFLASLHRPLKRVGSTCSPGARSATR